MALTETKVKNAKPRDKEYMIGDGQGLWLLVKPDGKKYWRLRYWVGDKERKISLGVYPIVGLKDARAKRDELFKMREKGNDPAETLNAKKNEANLSFEFIAREWIDKQINGVTTKKYTRGVTKRLCDYVFPTLGYKNIKEITAPQVLAVLQKIEEQEKNYTAHQVSQYCSRVFRYAIATGRAERDPVADLKGALKPHRKIHLAAIIDVEKIKQLLLAMKSFTGTKVVKAALWFSAYTFCRPGEIRQAEWSEINFDACEWRIPAEKMKTRKMHIVPLAPQVVQLLKDLYKTTGRGRYVFPNLQSNRGTQPMSANAVLYALRRMGFSNEEMTAHGFRGMASTRLNEMGWPPDVIERQLAHVEGNSVRAAYNHAEYLNERRKMMAAWADYLDELAVSLNFCVK